MRPLLKPFPLALQLNDANAPLDRKIVQNTLINSLGNYCSYCETPLGGCEIEHHKRLKAWQPIVVASDWQDMLLICTDCRSHAIKDVLSLQEKRNMLWPDEDISFTLNATSPILYQKRAIRYMVMNANGVVVDEPKSLVFVVPNPLAGNEKYIKTKNTIDYFQLNMKKDYFTEGSNIMVVPEHEHLQLVDHRTFQRTKTWEEAEAAVLRLQIFDQLPQDGIYQEMKELMHDQISATSFFTGNWSIWMTVFNNLLPNNHQLLNRLFVKDERYFKGIGVEKLGLNL